MDSALIDTDIILDFFFDRQPFSEYSAQIIGLCETESIKGYVTPVICSNLYYILRQTASHNKVIENLKQLLVVIDVLLTDKEIVSEAINSGFKDFEDALQYYSAMKNGKIDIIITRNLKDYKKSEISVMTPESYIKSIIARQKK